MPENLIASAVQNPLLAMLLGLVVILLVLVAWLSLRVQGLLKGSTGASLEGAIRTLIIKTERLEAHAKSTDATLKDHNRRIARAVQGVSVKRFDPFGASGGQQSFSTALLDEKGDGVVISGIHARGAVRVYAKEVTSFSSERELSEDEREAITVARKSLN